MRMEHPKRVRFTMPYMYYNRLRSRQKAARAQ